MKSHFTYIGEPQDILAFVRKHYPNAAFSQSGKFISIHDDIDINGAGGYGAVPSVVLREMPKPESIEIYKALKKQFKRKDKEVVLHYLGPDFV